MSSALAKFSQISLPMDFIKAAFTAMEDGFDQFNAWNRVIIDIVTGGVRVLDGSIYSPEYLQKFTDLEKRHEITPEKVAEMNRWDQLWEDFYYKPGAPGYYECKNRFDNKLYIP